MLWLILRLDRVSILELPRDRGEIGADRPRSLTLPLLFEREPLTSPSVSVVIIFCSSSIFRLSTSSSSAFLSDSSSLITSSSVSVFPSDDEGDSGRRGLKDFFTACNVKVDDDTGFLGRGVLFPSEVNLARTLNSGGNLQFGKRVLPDILERDVCLSPVGNASPFTGLGVTLVGLRIPISRIPRSSSWNRAFARYSK